MYIVRIFLCFYFLSTKIHNKWATYINKYLQLNDLLTNKKHIKTARKSETRRNNLLIVFFDFFFLQNHVYCYILCCFCHQGFGGFEEEARRSSLWWIVRFLDDFFSGFFVFGCLSCFNQPSNFKRIFFPGNYSLTALKISFKICRTVEWRARGHVKLFKTQMSLRLRISHFPFALKTPPHTPAQ